MPAAQTTSDIFTLLLGVVGVILLIALVVVIIWYVVNRKKGFKDSWKEMSIKIKKDSILNVPDYMHRLYRLPIPPLNEFLGRIEVKRDEKGKIVEDTTNEIVGKLRDIFSNQRTASVHLGNIIGFNRIDMLATVEDMLVPTGKYDKPLEIINQNQIDETKAILKKCGNFINVITYVPKKHKLFDLNPEEVILAWDDQLCGIQNQDGDLYILGQGTDRLAMYFSVVSGYGDRIKAVETYLIARGWIDWAIRLQAAMVEIVEVGMRMDTTTQKVLTASALSGSKSGGDKK